MSLPPKSSSRTTRTTLARQRSYLLSHLARTQIANIHTQQHPPSPTNMRSMNMPSYASQQPQQPNSASARQTPRLQNTQKPSLGNGTGWGFGLPNNSAGGAVPGGFAGAAAAGAALGSAPGLGPRPTQLSGFAQVMGGGGSQAPIDMR